MPSLAPNGGKLLIPPFEHQLSTRVSFAAAYKNITIEGVDRNNSIIHQDNTTGGSSLVFLFADATGTNGFTDLTYISMDSSFSPYKRGTKKVKMATNADANPTNFPIGGKVWINAQQCISGASGNARQPVAEILTVRSVDATTGLVEFVEPLQKDYYYDAAFPFGLAYADPNITHGKVFENLTFRNFKIISSGSAYAIWCRQAYNVEIDGLDVMCRTGITVRGRRIRLRRSRIHLTDQVNLDFPYWFASDTGSCDIGLSDNIFSADYFGSLHLHEGCASVVVRNQVIEQSDDEGPIQPAGAWPAISVAGLSWSVKLDKVLIDNAPFCGIRVADPWTTGIGYDDVNRGLAVIDCDLVGRMGSAPAPARSPTLTTMPSLSGRKHLHR